MRNLIRAAAFAAGLVWGQAAFAQGPVETFVNGCETEISNFCALVTPGEGRILACIYAHGDKLSGRCEYALYDAAVQLERAVNALSYVANECSDDINAHCAEVEIGQGRIISCLKANEASVSLRCTSALRDVGAW